MGLVVECVGVAGVGKSRLAGLVVDALGERAVPARHAMAALEPTRARASRVGRKAAYAVAELVRAPRASGAMVIALARSRQRRRGYVASLALNWLSIRRLARRAARSDAVHLFDQGPLVALWSAGADGDPAPVRAVLARSDWACVLPDVVLRVTAPAPQVARQVRGRGAPQSRLESLGDDELPAALARADRRLDEIAGWWCDGGERVLLHVANPGDEQFDRRADELADDLEVMWRGRRAASRDGTVRCAVG
jgi:hypothetical protein